MFGTPGNAANILRQSASVAMLGMAMMLVVLAGGRPRAVLVRADVLEHLAGAS